MARVLYLYTPNHDDELALKEVGSMVTVVSKTCADPGWFLGEIDGKKGLIPDNFVEFVKVPAASALENKKTSPSAVSTYLFLKFGELLRFISDLFFVLGFFVFLFLKSVLKYYFCY